MQFKFFKEDFEVSFADFVDETNCETNLKVENIKLESGVVQVRKWNIREWQENRWENETRKFWKLINWKIWNNMECEPLIFFFFLQIFQSH